MKQIIFAIMLFSCMSLTGQTQSDSIVVKKRLGTVFQQNDKYLTPKQLLTITQSNQEAFEEMKMAKKNYDVGYIFGCAGGFLIGWPIGTALAGGDANWTLAAVGAGLAAISIPFTLGYTKHAKNAVRFYNEGLKYSYLNETKPKIVLTYNGIGIQIHF